MAEVRVTMATWWMCQIEGGGARICGFQTKVGRPELVNHEAIRHLADRHFAPYIEGTASTHQAGMHFEAPEIISYIYEDPVLMWYRLKLQEGSVV